MAICLLCQLQADGLAQRQRRRLMVYRMLKYKVEYEEIDVIEYEKQYEEQQIKYMKKKAAKLGFQLVPTVPA